MLIVLVLSLVVGVACYGFISCSWISFVTTHPCNERHKRKTSSDKRAVKAMEAENTVIKVRDEAAVKSHLCGSNEDILFGDLLGDLP